MDVYRGLCSLKIEIKNRRFSIAFFFAYRYFYAFIYIKGWYCLFSLSIFPEVIILYKMDAFSNIQSPVAET